MNNFTIIIQVKNKIITIPIPLYSIGKVILLPCLFSAFMILLVILFPVGKKAYQDLDYKMRMFQYYKRVISENNSRLNFLGQMYDIRIPQINVNALITFKDLEKALKYQREGFNYINQERVSYDIVSSHTPISNPVFGGRVTSGMENRIDPIDGTWVFHEGLDIVSDTLYAPIYAPADGVVTKAEIHGGYGNLIVIRHTFGYETRYGHCSRIYVTAGEMVKRGQFIGRIGATGRATGIHLHYELRYNRVLKNPAHFL